MCRCPRMPLRRSKPAGRISKVRECNSEYSGIGLGRAVLVAAFFFEPPPVSFGWLGRQPHPLGRPLPSLAETTSPLGVLTHAKREAGLCFAARFTVKSV